MSEAADGVQNQLAKLKRKYAAGLPEKVAAVERQVASFLGSTWTEEVCFTTYRLLHSLAGSAGTYGYAELGHVARSSELLVKACLETRSIMADPQRKELEAGLAKMRELAAAAAAA